MKKILNKYTLLLILLIATFLRTYKLTTNPPGLNLDEVSIGYNAYSILKTGKDEWGRTLPLAFEAYGEYKLPLFIYASIPGIILFGPTDLGVRITPAFIGIATVYAFYLLLKAMLSHKHALAGSLLLAISPWHIHLTRGSFEASLALLLIMISLYYLHKSRSHPFYLIHTSLFASLALYAYNSARLLIPIYGIIFAILNWKWLVANLKYTLSSLALTALLLSPLFSSSSNQLVRWETLSITNDETFQHEIGLSRIYTPLPPLIEKILHNRYTHHAHRLYLNFLEIYSTDFLFLEGDKHTQRSVQGMGLLYLFELPLIVLGLTKLKKISAFDRKIILPLFIVSPIPSIITIDGPSALRALNLIIPLTTLSAIGAVEALRYNWSRLKRLSRFTVIAFIAWNLLYFLYREFWVYPVKYAADWQYGYKEAIHLIMNDYDEADRIFITTKHGEPYMYTLFYGGIDPALYQSSDVKKTRDETGWVHVDSFDKFHFIDFVSEINHPTNLIGSYSNEHLIFLGSFTELKGVESDWTITSPTWHIMFEKAEFIPDENNN